MTVAVHQFTLGKAPNYKLDLITEKNRILTAMEKIATILLAIVLKLLFSGFLKSNTKNLHITKGTLVT